MTDLDNKFHFVHKTRAGRQYTLESLYELILQQFTDETFGRPDIFAELDTPEKQRDRLQETADYVISVESLQLSADENIWLLDNLHKDLFRFGPLEGLFTDDTITEININAHNKLFKRHGFSELIPLDTAFRDENHLSQLIQRLLTPLGVDVNDTNGIIEVGFMFEGRPIRMVMFGPPTMPFYQGHIRLHPRVPLRLTDLQTSIPPVAAEMLIRIVQSGHGLLIVGDNNVGKTTLYAALFEYAAPTASIALLERTAEIHPAIIPNTFQRYLSASEGAPRAFDAQIHAALDRQSHTTIFMDEIRGDEQGAFWRLLTHPTQPQLITSFRGRGVTGRLHSGISMAIRKTDLTVPQAEIDAAFLERLPFIVVLSHPTPNTPPRFVQLAQWQPSTSGLTLEPLMVWESDQEPSCTAVQPCRDLGVSSSLT